MSMTSSSMRAVRRRRADLLAFGALLLGACSGSTDCGGCLNPLTETFPEASQTNGVVQTRLTPRGVDFLEQKLPIILQSFATIACDPALPELQRVPCPDGMTCVAGNHCEQNGQRVPLLGFRIPYVATDQCSMKICERPSPDQCLLYTRINSVQLTPTAPAHLAMSANTTLWSTYIPISRRFEFLDPTCWMSADCIYRVTKRDRTLAEPIDMLVDNPLQRLELAIGDPDVPLDSDDLEIDGHLGCDFIDLIMPLLFPLLEGMLHDQINSTVKNTANGMLVEGCDPSAVPTEHCNDAYTTYCDGDQRCRFWSTDRFVPKLLGIEGEIDLTALLGAFAGQASPVAVSAGAGGYAEVVRTGVEVGLRGGAVSEPVTCAPPLPTDLPAPPRLRFEDTIQPADSATTRPYMLGIAIADRMLEETGRSVVSSGALCQRLDAGLSSFVNTGAIGLLASSLNRITRNSALPALIEMLPRAPLSIDIGLGTSEPDPQDPNRTILDRPLLTFRARNLDLDLYALLDDRYVRFMTMRVDLAIGIGLEDDGNGNLLLLVSSPEDWLAGVEVLNSELLTDDPDAIANAVPSLVSALIGQLAPQLQQTFAIPNLAGFGLRNLTIRGVEPRLVNGVPVIDAEGNPIYEFLGLYSDLDFDPSQVGQPLRAVVDTVASVRELTVPPASGFNVDGPSGLQEPTLLLDVALANRPGSDRAEFTYRVDGGFWRPFHRGALLHVVDPILHLMGRHRVEVRGRLAGVAASLDPEPAVVEVVIDPLPPQVTLQVDKDGPQVLLQVEDAISAGVDLIVRHRFDLGVWNEQRGLAPIALPTMVGPEHRFDVEVSDEAGNVGRASIGGRPLVPAGPDAVDLTAAPVPLPEAAPDACGCRTFSGAPGLLVLLALLGARRRRR